MEQTLAEKLTVFQLVKKFPAFYGTRTFITAFTRVRHLSLSRTRRIQFMLLSHYLNPHLILLPSHIRLGLSPLCFPTKTLYAPLFSSMRTACCANFILGLITGIICGEEYKIAVRIETVLCAAVGTASHQHVLEACTVYGDPTVCSCRHSKSSS